MKKELFQCTQTSTCQHIVYRSVYLSTLLTIVYIILSTNRRNNAQSRFRVYIYIHSSSLLDNLLNDKQTADVIITYSFSDGAACHYNNHLLQIRGYSNAVF